VVHRLRQLLEEAIRLEPDYAAAHGFIAWCHEQRYLRGGLHAETRAWPAMKMRSSGFNCRNWRRGPRAASPPMNTPWKLQSLLAKRLYVRNGRAGPTEGSKQLTVELNSSASHRRDLEIDHLP